MKRRTAFKSLVLISTFVTGACVGAIAAQPHMSAALDSLRAARTELVMSTPNKGGHRARAISLVDQAIGETQAGIDFAQ